MAQCKPDPTEQEQVMACTHAHQFYTLLSTLWLHIHKEAASSELKSCTTVSPALVVTYASELGLGLRMKLKTSHMPARFYQ